VINCFYLFILSAANPSSCVVNHFLMLTFTSGNLFDSNAQALVNAVNTVGVMGKGIALQFKKRYPHNYQVYHRACLEEKLTTGQILGVRDQDALGERWIINFPTKEHWRGKSQYEYVAEGLRSLRTFLVKHDIESVAIPALGCGLGGLEWSRVKKMIVAELADLSVDCYVFKSRR
jgi:O-acetyl-ADP-ribose deacetylase (regulator of RNase III)